MLVVTAKAPHCKRVFILGAGFSRPAGMPLATELLDPLLEKLPSGELRQWVSSVRDRLAWMRQLLPEGQRDAASDERIIGTAACMIGGVILARAVGGKASIAVLDACREFLRPKGLHGALVGRQHRAQRARQPRPRVHVARLGRACAACGG